MRRIRNLIISLLLVLLLAVAAFLVLRDKDESQTQEQTPAQTSVYSVDSSALTGMSWTWEGGSHSLVKKDKLWTSGSNPEAPVDQANAASLATLASSVDYKNALDETAVPAEFGFDAPRLTLRLYLGDVTVDLEIGMRNDFAGGDYLRYQGKIYLIDTALYDTFAVGLEDLVPQDVLPQLASSDVKTLTLTTAEGSRTVYQPEYIEGAPRSDFYNWYELESETPVSSAAVGKVVAPVTSLAWVDCVAYQPADLSVYGLDDPVMTAAYQYETTDESGATTQGEITLLIGDYTEEEELLGQTGDLDEIEDLEEQTEAPVRYVYAKLTGSDLVYTLNASKLVNLQEAFEAYWGPTTVTQVTWDSLRAMRLTAGDNTVRLGIDRQEEQDEEGNPITNVFYDVDGRASSYEEIYDVFEQLRSMTAEVLDEFQTPEGEPTLAIELHRDSDLNTVVTVKFYPYDNSFYLVQADGVARLIVSRRDVQALVDAIDTLKDG